MLLVLMLAFGMVMGLAACGDPDPEDPEQPEQPGDGKVGYTVTVKDQDGAAVVGAIVEIYLQGVASKGEGETDANGQATFRLKEDSYKAAVVDAPLGYSFDEGVKVELKNGAATLSVEKLPSYTVNVVNEAGEAVVGAEVQLCDDEGCRLPKFTGNDGKVVFTEVESNYKAQILAAAGYVIDSRYHYFNGQYEITVVLVAMS